MSKKQDYDKKKQAKEERRQKRRARKQLGNKITLWGFFGLLTVGMLFVIFKVAPSAIQNSPNPAEPVVEDLNVTEEDNIRGAVDAPVTLVKYSDFQCPACATYSTVLEGLVDEFEGDVRLVYRHFPLPQNQNAITAAQAAEAAGNQGQFYAMHDRLFETQGEWSDESRNAFTLRLNSFAAELGLDVEQFSADLESEAAREAVLADRASGNSLGISSTPTIYVNNQQVQLAPQDLALLVAQQVQLANQVEASVNVEGAEGQTIELQAEDDTEATE